MGIDQISARDKLAYFQKRIIRVTGYKGSQDLMSILEKVVPAAGSKSPAWIIAAACMTPEEYEQHANAGGPWKFMVGKPELSTRSRDIERAIVEKYCSHMGLACDWSALSK